MSDTLADLTSWLPSEFLTGDIDDKALFLNSHNPRRLPYDFASSSSTESESDDEDIAGLTRRFTRSVSLQERMKTPYPLEMVFSGSPESTLNCNVSQFRSSPTTPFVQADEDAWDLIYAAAGQVARMKMKTSNVNDGVYGNRGVLGAPRPPGPPLTRHHHHHHHHHHPNCVIWNSENEEFIREQQFRLRFAGRANYGCGAGRPVGFRQPAWPSIPVENQRPQLHANGFVVKPVIGGSGSGCGRRTALVKRECAGTGVFLPRRYSNDPPELKKKPACPPAYLPARVVQSFNKNMDPINGQPQPNIHGGFGPHHQLPPTSTHHLKRDELAEMVIARRNALMLAQHRRSSTHVGLTETQEVVLPQEWTY